MSATPSDGYTATRSTTSAATDRRAESANKVVRRPWRRLSLLSLVACVVAVTAVAIMAAFFPAFIGLADESDHPGAGGVRATSSSTFDFAGALIPVAEIRDGGPGKDGIPALSDPKLISAAEATYLHDHDRVIGLFLDGEARAYPLRILNWHEVINDRVQGRPVAVTYCPLCDSAAIFDRRTPLGEREFGVSGLLYNSNVLMYDRGGRTESLWSQLRGTGVTGPGAGKLLTTLPVEVTTWGDWSGRHRRTRVLSPATGHRRDYATNPYGNYFNSRELMFPVSTKSDLLPPKDRVLGMWTDHAARAYPLSRLDRVEGVIEEVIDGHSVRLRYSREGNTVRVEQADDGVHWMYSLWFAWYAFRPQTSVFEASPGGN